MKFIFAVVLSILITGCAAPIVMVNVPDIEKSATYTIEDLRPKSEKESEILSLVITSDAYGMYRQGDQTNPAPLRILQHRIHEKYSQQENFPDVKVYHFVTYMNLQSEFRTGVVGGLIGATINALTQDGVEIVASHVARDEFAAFEDEYKRAIYSEKENPNEASVLQVYIDAEINGKRTFIKTMTPVHLEEQPNKIPVVFAIETAIAYYLDQYQVEKK